MSAADAALLELLRLLKARHYSFVTPTPATHARNLARPGRTRAQSIEDVLGWSLPFTDGLLPCDISDLLRSGDMLERDAGLYRSLVRVSSLGGQLYLHSAYPTVADDAIFFGPDSYRFADLISSELAAYPAGENARVVDVGTGAGVGAIVAAALCPKIRLTMTDINAKALRLARINAAAAAVLVEDIETSGLEGLTAPIDIIMMNPPYIVDDVGRTYRHGGEMHGGQLSLNLAQAAMERLTPGGRLLLYTGSAIVAGVDRIRLALQDRATILGCSLRYWEIDPDVFGEEMEKPQYADVDRIAAVGALATKLP